MTVCYFGIYDKDYSRNRINIAGLRQNGFNVIECCVRDKSLLKYFKLAFKYLRIKKKIDVVIVGFPGQTVVILAKIICGKKIFFDVFTSLYDSLVSDRQLVRPKSLKAKYLYFLDWLSCRLADKLILDTQAHIQYFIDAFKLSPDKFICLYVGSSDDIFFPKEVKKETGKLLIHFHASGIPLQGIEYVLKASKLLEKDKQISFNLIGRIDKVKEVKQLLANNHFPNINFIDSVSIEKLAKYINQADIVLGIFGQTNKAKRVIANKVFEGLACQKPVITARTTAAEELFVDKKNILFCHIADERDLADKIIELKDGQLRSKIAQNGYELFRQKLMPKQVVADLIKELKNNV